MTDTLTSVIAVSSIIVSLATLYYSFYQPAKIDILINSDIWVYHPGLSSTGVYLSATFLNNGRNQGAVHRCALAIYREGASQSRYFMLWSSIQKAVRRIYHQDHEAVPFTVPSNSSLNKMILFRWNDTEEHLTFVEGTYHLNFYVWVGTKRAKYYARKFHISKQQQEKLAQRIELKSRVLLEIPLDKAIEKNKVMTEQQAESLLTVT